MSIKVEWDDPNSNSEEYYVYRATAPIVDGSLPAPLVTIPSGTKTYMDLTAVRNTLYYYRIGSKVGTNINLSANKPLAYVPNVGPGPQSLIRGDWNLGYFGKMGINDLFVPGDLKDQFGLGGGVFVPGNPAADMYWLKMAYRGKVVYVASHPLVINITWESIYRAGLVYGNSPSADWPAYPKTAFGIIPQGVTLTRGQDQFLCRIPTSRVAGNTGTTPADLIGGEHDQLVMAPFWNTINNLTPYRFDDLNGAGQSFTQDFNPVGANATIIRGNTGNGVDAQSTSVVTATVVTQGWRPLLELVQ